MKICSQCGSELNDTAKFCNKCGMPLENQIYGGQQSQKTKEKTVKDVIKIVAGIIVLVMLFNAFSNPKDSSEAAVALQVAKNDMGSGFGESAVEFKVVAAKDDSKFIIKCEAVSDEAKEMYELVYNRDTCYYGVELGNAAGECFTSLGESERDVKNKMDW